MKMPGSVLWTITKIIMFNPFGVGFSLPLFTY